MVTNTGSTGHVAWEAVDSSGEGKHTHQGLKVLAVMAGIGCGKRPQRGVPLVALQGRGEQTAPQIGGQRVPGHHLPDGRPACRLHPGSRRVAGVGRGWGIGVTRQFESER